MSRDVLDYMDRLAKQVSRRRWAPEPEPAAEPEPQDLIPEDDQDLVAYREELVGTNTED